MSDFGQYGDKVKRKAEKAAKKSSKWYHLNIPDKYRPFFWLGVLFVLVVVVGSII